MKKLNKNDYFTITLKVQKPKYDKKYKCHIPKQEYWHCVIGPTTRKELRDGACTPMTMAVQEAFRALVGYPAKTCWSGWGYSEEEQMAAWNLSMTLQKKMDKEAREKKK